MKFKAIILGLILTICMTSWTYTYVYTYVYADTCVHTYNGKEINETLIYYIGEDGAYYMDGNEKVYIYTAEDNIVPFGVMEGSSVPMYNEDGFGVGYCYCEKCHTLIVLSVKQSEVIEDSSEDIGLEEVEDIIEDIKSFSEELTLKILVFAGPAIAAIIAMVIFVLYLRKKFKGILSIIDKSKESRLMYALSQTQRENIEIKRELSKVLAKIEGRKYDDD